MKYDLNHFIPVSSKIVLKPWYFFDNKLIKVPCFWEDDIHCMYNWDWHVEKYLSYKGIKVFNFHPIHIHLNTNNIEHYHKLKNKSNIINNLCGINNEKYGVYNFFIDLIDCSRKFKAE